MGRKRKAFDFEIIIEGKKAEVVAGEIVFGARVSEGDNETHNVYIIA